MGDTNGLYEKRPADTHPGGYSALEGNIWYENVEKDNGWFFYYCDECTSKYYRQWVLMKSSHNREGFRSGYAFYNTGNRDHDCPPQDGWRETGFWLAKDPPPTLYYISDRR